MNQSVEKIDFLAYARAIKKEPFQAPWINWVIRNLKILCLIELDQLERKNEHIAVCLGIQWIKQLLG